MCIRNKPFFLLYRVLVIFTVLLGLFLNLRAFNGRIDISQLNYYTILSNLICLFYFVGSLFVNLLPGRADRPPKVFLPRAKGAIVMCLMVTMLIYEFVVRPMLKNQPPSILTPSALQNDMVHLFVPALTIFDWVLFDEKGHYRAYDPFLWLLIPYIYLLYIFIRAPLFGAVSIHTKNRYPYKFINPDKIGWNQVLIHVAILSVVFLTLGYVIYGIDRWLGKRKHEQSVIYTVGRKVKSR